MRVQVIATLNHLATNNIVRLCRWMCTPLYFVGLLCLDRRSVQEFTTECGQIVVKYEIRGHSFLLTWITFACVYTLFETLAIFTSTQGRLW